MVRLNDPTGRHTVQRGLGCVDGSPNCSPDPRFTLDSDNYTNVFASGYPVSNPSTVNRTFTDILGVGVTVAQANADGSGDVLCPAANRPAPGAPGTPVTPVADSRRFAPVQIGDSVVVEGNFETINGVRFLSAHTSMIQIALTTNAADPTQPDYIFLDEVEIDAPGFENQRVRSLFIGYATQQPVGFAERICFECRTMYRQSIRSRRDCRVASRNAKRRRESTLPTWGLARADGRKRPADTGGRGWSRGG